MLKIENVETYGWKAAVRGMRNPKNSWTKSDSFFCGSKECCFSDDDCSSSCDGYGHGFFVGEKDLDLMVRLCNAGTDHSKFIRMVNVTLDIIAPLYWWKEFDTYKVGTVADSCSTMHKIHAKEFTLEDFSCEHLFDGVYPFEGSNDFDFYDTATSCLIYTMEFLNFHRKKYIETKDKRHWWQMIQLLPSSYNQRRTVQLNYQVLKNMYHARKNHKLDEWHTFCDWIESLPYSELITGRT